MIQKSFGRTIGVVAALAGIWTTAQSQTSLFGPGTFFHYRGMSAMAGGGFGVMPDGSTGMEGAMAISTPIGFSLRNWHGAIGASSLSYNDSPQGINAGRYSQTFKSSSVADGMVGYGGNWGAVTVSYQILSSILDHVENVQYELPISSKWFGFSVGAQDVFSHGGAGGYTGEPGVDNHSRSLFAVGTAMIQPGLSVSLGKGDFRFQHGVFGNASYSVTPRVKLVGEYDTFGWNTMVAYGLGRIPGFSPHGRDIEPVLSAGYVGGDRAILMVNVAF